MEIETNSEGITQMALGGQEVIMITNKSRSHFKKIYCCPDGTLEEIGEVIL